MLINTCHLFQREGRQVWKGIRIGIQGLGAKWVLQSSLTPRTRKPFLRAKSHHQRNPPTLPGPSTLVILRLCPDSLVSSGRFLAPQKETILPLFCSEAQVPPTRCPCGIKKVVGNSQIRVSDPNLTHTPAQSHRDERLSKRLHKCAGIHLVFCLEAPFWFPVGRESSEVGEVSVHFSPFLSSKRGT